MIDYERYSDAFTLKNGGYWVHYWKPNHMAYGKYPTAGCWNTRYSGRNASTFAEHLQTATFWGAKTSGLSETEFRDLFAESERLDFRLYVTAKQVYFFWKGSKIEVKADAIGRQQVKNAIEKMAIEQNKPATAKIQAADSKAAKRAEAVARTRALMKQPEPKAAEPELIEAPAPVVSAPYSKTPEARAGLAPEKVPAFRKWARGLRGSFKTLPLPAQFDAFLAGGDAKDWEVVLSDEPAPELVEPTSPIILHDAHVFAYRRNRANRLKALRRVAVRDGHGRFRVAVLANHNGCAITGLKEGIEAAHIVPVAMVEDMRPGNGVALVNWLHAAFDALAFSIEPIGLTVVVAPAARQWLNIDGLQLVDGAIWPFDRSALAHHFERFKEAHRQ